MLNSGGWGEFPALLRSARPGIGLRPRYGVRSWSTGAAVWDSGLPERLIDVETDNSTQLFTTEVEEER